MKILYLVSGLSSVGGIENFCYSVIEHINLQKYNIDFLVSECSVGNMEEYVESKGCKVYHINHDGTTKDRVKKRNEFFKEHCGEYEIVHIHAVLTTAFQSAKAAKKYGAKCVIVHSHTASNFEGTKLKNNLCRALLNHYTDVRMACSINSGEFLFGKRFVKGGIVINNGIDYNKFRYNPAIRQTTRKELNISEDCFVIGHVGRMAEAKNHAFLVNIFAEVVKSCSDVKLLLVGDGPNRQSLEEQAIKLRIDKNVIFCGNQKDAYKYYNAMDMFVFPSLYEGAPISVIEAQVNGLNTIISERITKEIKISESLKVLRLEYGCEAWAKNIMDNKGKPRCDNAQDDFEIEKCIKKLEDVYDGFS